MKKLIVAAALAGSILAFPSSSFANDIQGHYFEKEMRYLNDRQIMLGDGTGNFEPERNVTRAEFAAFMTRSLDLPEGTSHFLDVSTDNPLSSAISSAADAGIIKGDGNGYFSPDRPITREEIAVMIDRALTKKGIEAQENTTLTFKDSGNIAYLDAVKNNVSHGIIKGNDDGTFRPKDLATRAQSAAFLYRMINVLDGGTADPTPPAVQYEYQIKSGADRAVVGQYATLAEAKQAFTGDPNTYITKGDEVVWMSQGQVVGLPTNGTVKIYPTSSSTSQLTYVSKGTIMEFRGFEGNRVKIHIQGFDGYVDVSDTKLIPSPLITGTNYYKAQNGLLYHVIYNPLTGKETPYIYNVKPPFLADGQTSYSSNGYAFDSGVAYSYFNYLPVRTKTSYTAEQLDAFVYANNKNSVLVGLGKTFKEAEAKYNINALYMLSHAILESSWGTSPIAVDKKNLFGIEAYDSNAYDSAKGYASYEDCIDYYAKTKMHDQYAKPGTWYYAGAYPGNKAGGMNVRYASDPYWGQKIAGIMLRADQYLGGQDRNKYRLAVTTVDGLNVRTGPSTSYKSVYKMAKPGTPFIIAEYMNTPNGLWYKIVSEDPGYDYLYVHGGDDYAKAMPLP